MQLTSASANELLFVPTTKKSRILYSGSSTTPRNSNKISGWVSQNLSGPHLDNWANYWGWNTRLCPSPTPLARSWVSTLEPPEEGGKDSSPRKMQVSPCSIPAPYLWQVVPGPTNCSPLGMPHPTPWKFLHKQISVLGRNQLLWSLHIMGSRHLVFTSIPRVALFLEIPKNISSTLTNRLFQDAAMILFCY